MRALLMSGLGPTYKNFAYLSGSMFDSTANAHSQAMLARAGYGKFNLRQLSFEAAGHRYALLRPRRTTMPHLTTFTLESIIATTKHDYALLPLETVWEEQATLPTGDFDVVLLSTTYIWNKATIRKALTWIRDHAPGIPVILGGQYSNLKYMNLMRDHPMITAIIRGDGEAALPGVLDALAFRRDLALIPNLVWRDGGGIHINPVDYIDIDAWPSPQFDDHYPIVPYESMRGCPFDCKFCSFPAASPKWRYKSAEKIRDDWVRYAEVNGAQFIEAMDSTFTVPPTRLRRLLQILPAAGVAWEGYSRANVINSPEFIDGLVDSHCRRLQIGFESMNDEVLARMSKRVSAQQNRRAFDLLRVGGLGYTVFFMIGYPGESPEHFLDTEQFLLDEFSGHFMLSVFSVSDETMPLWRDRDELGISIADPEEPDADWSHVGMDIHEARRLNASTLDKVRRLNDDAVTMLWQGQFQHWFMPHIDRRTNLTVEKCVERIAMSAKDYSDVEEGAHQVRSQLALLKELGVTPCPEHELSTGQVEAAHVV